MEQGWWSATLACPSPSSDLLERDGVGASARREVLRWMQLPQFCFVLPAAARSCRAHHVDPSGNNDAHIPLEWEASLQGLVSKDTGGGGRGSAPMNCASTSSSGDVRVEEPPAPIAFETVGCARNRM